MNHQNHTKVCLEITPEKLVDILMHTATREDIAKLDKAMREDIARLDRKIDTNEIKVREDIARLDKKIDSNFETLNTKIDKFYFLMFASILIPIALHFIK